MTQFDIPRIVPVSEPVMEDPVPHILKYLYHMEDFEVIRKEINENNVIFIYSLAYAMRMPKLKRDLEEFILKEMRIMASELAPKHRRSRISQVRRLCHLTLP